MFRQAWRWVVVCAVAIAFAGVTHAQSLQEFSLSDNERSDLWLVELSSPPTSDGTSMATLEREEANFHSAATAAGVRYTKSKHFRELWNGVTVRASARDVSKLRALPGVLGVYPDVKISLSQQEQPPDNVIELATALKMTGADVAQSELGLSGRGVRVAVIDTGVDFDHPDLGGCFGKGCRVAKGFDFVGDAFNNSTVTAVTPDPVPDDCHGHGTHVAGIIGAKGGLKGVAPGVTIHAYRVFGCAGTTTSEIMIAAMERARRDNADVVNMSIGAALQWPQYPTSKAADRLVRHGIVVVAAAGNEASFGLYGAAAPSVAEKVIGVASFDNTHVVQNAFQISGPDTLVGFIPATGAPAPPTAGTFPIARTGTTASAADACSAPAGTPPLPGSLAGKIALIRRGTCSFYEKAFNAQAAGAAGVVLYNNAAGFLGATVAGTPPITIPVVGITQASGVLINNRLDAGVVDLTWTNQQTTEANPTANRIASTSSYGLAADLSLKPDIGAPGGSIRLTLPLEQGGYGTFSGTSMASPHVAGAAALLLEAKPYASTDEVQRRLQNSARPHLWSVDPTLGFLDYVHRQGAGMLHIDDAVQADAVVSPSKLALGEIVAAPGSTVPPSTSRWLRIARQDSDNGNHHRRRGRHHHDGDECDAPVTYTLGHEAALSTGPNTFAPAAIGSFATVQFANPTVTVGGRQNGRWRGRDDDDGVAFQVTVTPPASANARLFGGYITLTPNDGGQVLRVPYAGYNGDYQAIQVFTLAGLPALAKLIGTTLFLQPGGAAFTMVGDDVPFILLHLNHQVANLKMEVFDVTTGRSMNFAHDEDWVGRNSTATSAFVFAWDGTTTKRAGGRSKTVPNGTYRIDLSILKALGDPRNPAHFERWSSPNIVISRPAPTPTPTP